MRFIIASFRIWQPARNLEEHTYRLIDDLAPSNQPDAFEKQMIVEMGQHERLPVFATEERLIKNGFGPTTKFHALIAENEGRIGGHALFFDYHSSFQGCGIFLEDLFVRYNFRGSGIGQALLSCVAARVVELGYFGIIFYVLDRNGSAQKFFEGCGASELSGRKTLCVTGTALRELAKCESLKTTGCKHNPAQTHIQEPLLSETTMARIERVSTFTIAVKDQEQALQWFTEKLDFEKRVDVSAPGMRWLTVAPKRQKEVQFVVATWFPNSVGKNLPCVLETQDCRSAYQTLKDRVVPFSQSAAEKPYGVEAVFQDLYGNSYALVERR